MSVWLRFSLYDIPQVIFLTHTHKVNKRSKKNFRITSKHNKISPITLIFNNNNKHRTQRMFSDNRLPWYNNQVTRWKEKLQHFPVKLYIWVNHSTGKTKWQRIFYMKWNINFPANQSVLLRISSLTVLFFFFFFVWFGKGKGEDNHKKQPNSIPIEILVCVKYWIITAHGLGVCVPVLGYCGVYGICTNSYDYDDNIDDDK